MIEIKKTAEVDTSYFECVYDSNCKEKEGEEACRTRFYTKNYPGGGSSIGYLRISFYVDATLYVDPEKDFIGETEGFTDVWMIVRGDWEIASLFDSFEGVSSNLI